MYDNSNPLLCDPQDGFCEMPATTEQTSTSTPTSVAEKPISILYYTDPICSSCWGIEPQLRKLKLEYGDFIDIDYRMGGLLPDWNYNSGGISKPEDVAHHWEEAGAYYDMPIDGDVWIEDPLHSSYPPSIAFKAAQLQNKEKAILFLRELREMVFLRKLNITKWEHIEAAALNAGLDADLLRTDYDGRAAELFNEDLKLGRMLGVRGFPTLFLTNAEGERELVYGARPYTVIENAVIKLLPTATKTEYPKKDLAVFSHFASLTAREFAELTETDRRNSEQVLNQWVAKGALTKSTSRNGAIWRIRSGFSPS